MGQCSNKRWLRNSRVQLDTCPAADSLWLSFDFWRPSRPLFSWNVRFWWQIWQFGTRPTSASMIWWWCSNPFRANVRGESGIVCEWAECSPWASSCSISCSFRSGCDCGLGGWVVPVLFCWAGRLFTTWEGCTRSTAEQGEASYCFYSLRVCEWPTTSKAE